MTYSVASAGTVRLCLGPCLTADSPDILVSALSSFPLEGQLFCRPGLITDAMLASKARRLVIWSLDEERGKGAAMGALQLATNPAIATPEVMQELAFRSAQLLLSDGACNDPIIV